MPTQEQLDQQWGFYKQLADAMSPDQRKDAGVLTREEWYAEHQPSIEESP